MPGRVCEKHGTGQWCPDGVCPYCEPGTPCSCGLCNPSAPATCRRCSCGLHEFPAGTGYRAADGSHTATSCPDQKLAPDIHVNVHGIEKEGVLRVASSPAFQEALKKLRRNGNEGSGKIKLSWGHALLEPGDTYDGRRVVSVEERDDGIELELEPTRLAANAFWRADPKPQPPPTPNQVIEWMETALRAPPRPPGPVIVSPELGAALLAKELRSHEPDVLRTVAPSPEECAAWAVCEFLRWGATACSSSGLCRCGTYLLDGDVWFDHRGYGHTAARCPRSDREPIEWIPLPCGESPVAAGRELAALIERSMREVLDDWVLRRIGPR